MLIRVLAGVLVVLGAAMSANATSVTFDFNTLASGKSSSDIQSYMDGILHCANCVTVTGAVADKTYNGDGHVVGPLHNGTRTSLTLGDSNGAINNSAALNTDGSGNIVYDTFIANTNDSSQQISNQITITFTNAVTLNGFDYEAFPDGSGATPDFTLGINGNTTTPPAFTQYGVLPSSLLNGSSLHSPNSGSSTEGSAQYIGTWSGNVSNVTRLDFVDWPATIGVDNIKVTTSTPEPSVIELCPFLLGGVLFFRRRLVALADGVSDSA